MTGPEMRQTRKRLGLTQTELAQELGFATQTRISAMENGKAPITARTAKAMGLLVKAKAAELLAALRPDAA